MKGVLKYSSDGREIIWVEQLPLAEEMLANTATEKVEYV